MNIKEKLKEKEYNYPLKNVKVYIFYINIFQYRVEMSSNLINDITHLNNTINYLIKRIKGKKNYEIYKIEINPENCQLLEITLNKNTSKQAA